MTAGGKPFAVMGIVNVTADSFYDGGRYGTVDAAVAHALRLVGDGADIIDIGGSSSRPGARLLSPEEEMARVVPVIEELARRGVGGGASMGVGAEAVSASAGALISVDTTWSAVARTAIGAGASWVNDISAGRIDPGMARTAAGLGCTVVLTHSRGTPEDMQDGPRYENVVIDVCRELSASIRAFREAGVGDDRIVIDPGFGFGKTVDHNVELLRGIGETVGLGYPVLVGLSRKSFIGALTGRSVEDRLPGTLAATAAAYRNGARIFRAHDVRETVDFLKILTVGAAVPGAGNVIGENQV